MIGFWSGERPEIAENFKKIFTNGKNIQKSLLFLAQPIYRVAQPVPSLIHIYYINVYHFAIWMHENNSNAEFIVTNLHRENLLLRYGIIFHVDMEIYYTT